MRFKIGDIVFLNSECGEAKSNLVPISRLCMIKNIFSVNKVCVAVVEKQSYTTTFQEEVLIDDLRLFKPSFQKTNEQPNDCFFIGEN